MIISSGSVLSSEKHCECSLSNESRVLSSSFGDSLNDRFLQDNKRREGNSFRIDDSKNKKKKNKWEI